jgi:squalene-hopene/tetraprenyl-beta-curcumene cyclase
MSAKVVAMRAVPTSRKYLQGLFAVSLFGAIQMVGGATQAADAPKPKPKPSFQYQTSGVEISIPTAGEAKFSTFDRQNIEAAAKYLEGGAISWVREKNCINCHTTGPYMAERPGLSRYLGMPQSEVRDDFVKCVPDQFDPAKTPSGGLGGAVWRTLGLAEWDKHISGSVSEATDRSLRDILQRQSANGGFASSGEVEIPHITTDFELSLQAARAITAAPGWLAELQDADLRKRVDKLKEFLQQAKPRNDYERVLRLQLAAMLPQLVSAEEVQAALGLLSDKQHADGGWSLRDMSATDNWRTPMSDTVLKLIASLPDVDRPESDPYMTALAIVLMREVGVPSTDARIQRGIAWLKQEQRVSGRWWMHSLYRGNYHYITYIATAQAMKALALCGELPEKVASK